MRMPQQLLIVAVFLFLIVMLRGLLLVGRSRPAFVRGLLGRGFLDELLKPRKEIEVVWLSGKRRLRRQK